MRKRRRCAPLRHPLLAHHLDVALVDGRLEHLQLALAQHLRVVVGRRAAEQEVVALRLRVVDALRLQFADLLVIERDVGVDIGIENQAVIRHDLDARFVRFGHDVTERFRIERHDHDHIDAARNQVFDLRDLPLFAGIGRLHGHLGAELFRCGDKIVAIARPAFDAQVVDTEANFWMILARVRKRRGERQAGEHRSTHERTQNGTTRCEFHVSLLFCYSRQYRISGRRGEARGRYTTTMDYPCCGAARAAAQCYFLCTPMQLRFTAAQRSPRAFRGDL